MSKRTFLGMALSTLGVGALALLGGRRAAAASPGAASAAGDGTSAWDFAFDDIAGQPLPLSQFRDRVLLVVNTASFCGFTGQYEGLEQLHQQYAGRGLVVLGVPSNDFGNQEPGTEAEIREFCDARFNITFALTSKQAVVGRDAHPLYQWLARRMGSEARPRWNFHKYIIGRDGQPAAWFSSFTTPTNSRVIAAIEQALAP